MATRSEDPEGTFTAWTAAREPELQRTAHLLTGDLGTARAHVESALAAALGADSSGGAGRDGADRDAVALHALVGEVLGGRGAGLDREAGDVGDPRQELVWDFLSTFSPAHRAALVLRLHRQLGDVEIAGLVGSTPAAVADDLAGALDDLAALLRAPTAEAVLTARSALATRADATPVVPTPMESVRAVARRRRTRRTRGGLVVATAALVVVGVPVAALSGGGLPDPPPAEPAPGEGPGEGPDHGPEDRVPPPWVLPPSSQELRVDLRTECSSASDEEFRSTTTIRAGCRTFVIDIDPE